jgi:hypothetical protein
MTPNDEFDQLLDGALAEYREAEPLAGLEDRVLQRLRLQTEQRRKLWWRWSAIAAAAAALVIVAWIGMADRTRQDAAAPSVVQKQATPAEPQPPTVDTRAANQQPASKRTPGAQAASHSAPVPASMQLVNTQPAPMRERFPSPAPLKPEERMLLALVTTRPEILTDKPGDDKEIVIDPINIKPLVDETRGYQGEN